MKQRLRRLLRTRCRHLIRSGDIVFSYRNPDTINPDGTFKEGARIDVRSSFVCARWRFHFGEHREPEMKACIPVECPPPQEYGINWEGKSHE